jgi:hypothetical protein
MCKRTVTVKNKMQKSYFYVRSEPISRNFDLPSGPSGRRSKCGGSACSAAST